MRVFNFYTFGQIFRLVSQQQICSKQDAGIYQTCIPFGFLDAQPSGRPAMASWGWGCAGGHPPTCTSHKCEHKGNQETPHGEQDQGFLEERPDSSASSI